MDNDTLSHQYDLIADTFDASVEDGARVSREAFRGLVPSLQQGTVLDMGCGEGIDCQFYQESGADHVIGLDASKELLKKASAKHPSIIFEYGNFENLPFKDNLFGFVFSKYALQTTKDLDPIFEEVLRVLITGGIFMFLVVHPIRQL